MAEEKKMSLLLSLFKNYSSSISHPFHNITQYLIMIKYSMEFCNVTNPEWGQETFNVFPLNLSLSILNVVISLRVNTII